MTTLSPVRTRSQETWQTVRSLLIVVLGLSAATVLAMVLLRGHPDLVTTASWVRGSIVLIDAVLLSGFARRAAHGHRRSLLRLRLVSAITVLAIVVIDAVPGTFPLWLKVEQGAVGLLMVAVVVLVNRRSIRTQP